jgi:hypothetical protein
MIRQVAHECLMIETPSRRREIAELLRAMEAFARDPRWLPNGTITSATYI